MLALYGRLPTYHEFFAREGFEREVNELTAAWARNDFDKAVKAISDEMVTALSASGTPEEVLATLGRLMRRGLKGIVLYPCPGEHGAKETIIEIVEGLKA